MLHRLPAASLGPLRPVLRLGQLRPAGCSTVAVTALTRGFAETVLLLLLQCGKALQGGSCPDFPQLPLRSSILWRASCVLHQDVARMLWQFCL